MKTYTPGMLLNWPCYVQPKLNGINCTLRTDGVLVSRTDKTFPAVQKARSWTKPPMDLHGELYVHGWSLQRIMAAVTPNNPTNDTKDLQLHVYDIGQDLAMRDKAAILVKLFPTLSPFAKQHIFAVPTRMVDSYDKIKHEYNCFRLSGYEGIIIRDSMEQCFKLKPYTDEEYICKGVIEGKGKRRGHVGKFIFQGANGITFHCGGGQVSYKVLRELFITPPIGALITVRYHSKSERGIPLCAQFIAIRNYE